MSITCRVMTDDDRIRWDDFVLAHPAGHFFHRAAWQDVIKTAFGQRPYFMLAERAGAICGLL
ncbi:MAG: hypothetical protein B7X01_00095, partial [Acidiphilium sp. 21-62-4]